MTRDGMKSERKLFGELLRLERTRQRLTQAELGQRSGVDRFMIAHIEAGRRAPAFETFVSLVAGLRVSADSLLGIGPWTAAAGAMAEGSVEDRLRKLERWSHEPVDLTPLVRQVVRTELVRGRLQGGAR